MSVFRFKLTALLLFTTLSLASVCTFGETWYVDPVNGDDAYDGSSPFHIRPTMIGPTQTIDAVLYAAGPYDILVLMDGTYSGPLNTSSTVMDAIDALSLYVVSNSGPENCTLELYEQIVFTNLEPASVPKRFSGMTFTSSQRLQQSAILIDNPFGTMQFEDCVFSGFQADNLNAAVIDIPNRCAPKFEGCIFSANKVQQIIQCSNNANPRIYRSSFTDNENVFPDSSQPFRIISVLEDASITVFDTKIAENSSTAPLIAISAMSYGITGGGLSVDQCIIENNTSTYEDEESCIGIKSEGPTRIRVQDTQIENLSVNSPFDNGLAIGVYIAHAETLLISNCKINNNNVGLYMTIEGPAANTLEILDSEFIGNKPANANYGYPYIGGICFYSQGSLPALSIRNCTVQKNSNGISGYGAWMQEGSIKIQNCLITDNERTGIELTPALTPHTISNCTIANNGEFGMIACNTIVKNTILRQEPGIPVADNGDLVFNYCNIEGGWTGQGVGNINADPLFINPGYWDDTTQSRVPGTDYHVMSNAGWYDAERDSWIRGFNGVISLTDPEEDSPCIDAGDPADFSGNEPYSSGGRMNMGCYGGTWQASKSNVCIGGVDGTGKMLGDIDHDCRVNLADFAWFATDWLESTLQEPIPLD